MKFCEECGAQLDDDVMFCEECGAVLESNENSVVEETSINQIKKEDKKKRVPIMILIAVISLVIMVIGIMLLRGINGKEDRRFNADRKSKESTEENLAASDENEENAVDAESWEKLFGDSPYGIYMTGHSYGDIDFYFYITKKDGVYLLEVEYWYSDGDYNYMSTELYEDYILYGEEYVATCSDDPSWYNDITFGIDADGYCSFEWWSGYRVMDVVVDTGIPAVNSDIFLFDTYEAYLDYLGNVG